MIAAALRALELHGVGAGGGRGVAAGTEVHAELERRLAAFKGTAAARVYQSGYAANTGVIPLLAGAGDAVILDERNHQSSRDGATLSGAQVHTYAHADVTALERVLASVAGAARRMLIVTDGVFGVDGDVAPLGAIVAAAERFGARVLVDDAHGTGVLGDGHGTVAAAGLQTAIAVQVGTLSKALGSLGGFVATSDGELIARWSSARPEVYSSALPAHLAAAALTALDILEREPERVAALWRNRQALEAGLRRAGADLAPSASAILSLKAGAAARAIALGERLRASGLRASVVLPPRVAEGAARLRFLSSAAHSADDVDRAVAGVAAAGAAD